ncbi:Protein of unknown function [Gryllus bimaculatus]|nr:Protein of unknown function [Gryllus bimaculatus]
MMKSFCDCYSMVFVLVAGRRSPEHRASKILARDRFASYSAEIATCLTRQPRGAALDAARGRSSRYRSALCRAALRPAVRPKCAERDAPWHRCAVAASIEVGI